MAASPPQAKANAAAKPDFPSREMAVPAAEKAPVHKKTEKAPTPQAKPEPAEEEEPADSPAEAEDITDCDDCVIVQAVPARSG
ncbi:MAG TPA: hypothetical protein VJ385_04930, partial [Fibrobacteria bacterium]|nr:hypothetical protein [Fibrobacteria bacterium]